MKQKGKMMKLECTVEELRNIEEEFDALRKLLVAQFGKMTMREQKLFYPKKLDALNALNAKVEKLQTTYDAELCIPIAYHAGNRIARARNERELKAAVREYNTRYLFGNGMQKSFCVEEELIALTEAVKRDGKLGFAASRRYKELFCQKYPQFKGYSLEISKTNGKGAWSCLIGKMMRSNA